MPDTPDAWSRLEDLVPEALDLPAHARGVFLDAACVTPDGAPDPVLRREAARLVASFTAAEAEGRLVSPFEGLDDTPLPGPVGPWRVTGVLGRGGMGTVYRATRDDATFEQHAALKLVHAWLGTDFRARFLRERALLAGLDHSGVARLLDGGLAADGAPYLAMELVDGVPITDVAGALPLAERLGLFLQACDAVAHAHLHAVVHRDLKPAHILVEDTEQGPRVKLLDFGIAKLLSDADDGMTRTGASGPLTPSYASPEQLSGAPITTATDVYGLGLVLFEVLTGHRAIRVDGLSAAEAERAITETAPPAASAVAPHGTARALRGDLDVIVAKALAKEPARRYATAADLAADLRRHLNGLPVEARPASARYRAGRFLRRHRVAAVATSVVVVALVAGAGVALWQAQKARVGERKAVAVNDFLVGLLASADPTVEGRDVRVASLLDHAAATIDSTFAGQPDVAATMHRTLGETYRQLGLLGEAEAQYRRALALRERIYGPRNPDVMQAQSDLGYVWTEQDRLVPADSVLTLAVATARTLRGWEIERGGALSNLGALRWWQGDAEAALDLHRQAVAVLEGAPTPNEVEIAAGYGNIAVVLHALGRDAEAVAYMERQLAVYRQTYEPTNARIAMAQRNLSSGYYGLRRYDDALRANEQALALFRRGVEADSPDLASTLSNHGPILIKVGRYAEAEAAEREAMAIYARTDGTQHQNYAAALLKAGQAEELQGRLPEAEADIRRAIAIFRAGVPEDHPAMGHTQLALGRLLAAQTRYAEAAPVLRRAFAIRSADLAPDHPDRADIASLLGDVLAHTGDRAAAESLLVAGDAVLRRTPGDDRAPVAAARLAAFRTR